MATMIDRSSTPRVSQMAQSRRTKTRSQSGSEELNQIIEQGQKARLSAATSNDMTASSSSSSSSGLASPATTPVPDRLQSPGVLSWVRNALGRGASSPLSATTPDTSIWTSATHSYLRRLSTATETTADDDTASSSSEEDVYAPFTFKEDDGVVPSALLEKPSTAYILPQSTQETSLAIKSLANSFSSHLSIHQTQDYTQVVRDTTTTMPDLILTPPDSTLQESAPLSPSSGWVDHSKRSRVDSEERNSHNKTPTPGNKLDKLDQTIIDSTDSTNSFLSTDAQQRKDPDQGDGEDLDDLWGRPRSPEELANARPSREVIVLGSRGANARGRNPLVVATPPHEGLEDEQEYWSATSPKTPSTDTSAQSLSMARLAIERRGQSEGVVNTTTQTASPQPRRAMNFFTRRRETSEAEKSEGSRKTPPASNQTFWRLGRKQSSANSTPGIDAESVVEREGQNVRETTEKMDVVEKLPVQSPSMRASYESDRSNEPATPSKGSARAITSNTVAKGSCSKKKEGATLLGPSMQPRNVKVRRLKKTTKDRDFARVYLAQELILNVKAEEGLATTDTDLKPVLAHLDSSGSLASSSTMCSKASSAMSAPKKKATWAMKFSIDGKYLAVAGQDAIIRVYAVLDTEEARRKVKSDADAAAEVAKDLPGSYDNGSTCSVNSLGKTPAGRKSVSSREAPPSSLPNLAVFRPDPIREFKGHTNDILDLCWSKGGFLLSASMDKTVRVWNLSHPNSLVSFVHGDFVTCATFHPRDDRFFLSGSLDGKVRLWNISAKKVVASREVPGLITACAFTETGNTACVGTFAGHALFYQTEGLVYSSSIAVKSPSGKHAKGGRKITSISPLLSVSGSSSTSSATSPTKSKGERILVTSNDSRIRAYDLKNKSMIARFKAKTYTNRTSQIRANVSDDNIFIVAGSEATYNEGGQVHIWNTSNHLSESNSRKTSTKSIPSSLSTDFNVEYFSAHSGTVTCAVMAPLSTNAHLKASNDYLLQESDRRLAYNAKSLSPSASLSNAFSNAVQYPIKLATGNNEVDARRLNRIIVSVDENAVVRVFRSDSLQTVEG